jgi:hypothetical protein
LKLLSKAFHRSTWVRAQATLVVLGSFDGLPVASPGNSTPQANWLRLASPHYLFPAVDIHFDVSIYSDGAGYHRLAGRDGDLAAGPFLLILLPC